MLSSKAERLQPVDKDVLSEFPFFLYSNYSISDHSISGYIWMQASGLSRIKMDFFYVYLFKLHFLPKNMGCWKWLKMDYRINFFQNFMVETIQFLFQPSPNLDRRTVSFDKLNLICKKCHDSDIFPDWPLHPVQTLRC